MDLNDLDEQSYLQMDDSILNNHAAQLANEIYVEAILKPSTHAWAQLDGVVLEWARLNLCQVDVSESKSWQSVEQRPWSLREREHHRDLLQFVWFRQDCSWVPTVQTPLYAVRPGSILRFGADLMQS